jgi:hypothetical protein
MDVDVACVNWLMMLHSCMLREVSLVDHTNINIDDAYLYAYSCTLLKEFHL